MDISNHINLIKNHGYDGYIAVYCGPEQGSFKMGMVLLVQNEKMPKPGDASSDSLEWLKNHRTVERPHSEEHIQKNISEKGFKGIITYCCCVGVPKKYLEEIKI